MTENRTKEILGSDAWSGALPLHPGPNRQNHLLVGISDLAHEGKGRGMNKKHPSRLVVGCHVCSFAQDPLLGADIPDLSVGMSVGSVQKYNFSTTPPNILAKKFILRPSERISGFQGGIYPPTSKNAFYGHFWAKFAIYTDLSRERVLHTLWIMDRAMTGQSQTSSSESPT